MKEKIADAFAKLFGRLSKIFSSFLPLIERLAKPGRGILVTVYPLTIVFIAASLIMLFLDFNSSAFLSILAYLCFAAAAVLLGYSVYTLVLILPNRISRLRAHIEAHPVGGRLIGNWSFRTLVTATFSFVFSLINAAFNGFLGISQSSIWFGALSAYYVFIALMRGGLLIYHRRSGYDGEAVGRARNYRNCGVKMLILNLALSSAIAQMIFEDRAFSYKDWFIFAFAAYAFYKIIMAIRNFIKAHRQDSVTLRAIREVGLVDAAVSILALQTALLHTFSADGVDISLFNTLTGSAVSIFAISLGILMIRKGANEIRAAKRSDHS